MLNVFVKIQSIFVPSQESRMEGTEKEQPLMYEHKR